MISYKTYSFLKKSKIMGENETYEDMVYRVFSAIAQESQKFGYGEREIASLTKDLSSLFTNRYIIPGTPILANAGRNNDKPLSACSVPPIEYRLSKEDILSLVKEYQKKDMGTGFNLDESTDPVSDLYLLNDLSIEQTDSGILTRVAASMAILSIDHPKILEFAAAKSGKNKERDWKYNISVNVTEKFIDAVRCDERYILKDGTEYAAQDLLHQIVSQAHECGDPGMVFLDRFEQYNITPHLGKYVSFAPCGEIAMANGETCQFSYINLANFFDGQKIDYDYLEYSVENSVMLLDNALEITARNIGNVKSAELIKKKRKIGVGVCGFSDLLRTIELPYNTNEARNLAEDLMSFINYKSKLASVILAEERGAFPAFYDPETKKDLIFERFLGLNSNTVKDKDWKRLEDRMYSSGIRNVSTTALPPTGKSSLIIGASPSIEPIFRLSPDDIRDDLSQNSLKIVKQTGSCQETDISNRIKDIYKTCLELSAEEHLRMVVSFQKYTDESISKTVNLPNDCTPEDIMNIYLLAHDLGLKGITVFRNGSKKQPIELSR